MTAPDPQPIYVVRCSARGCDWSVTINTTRFLARSWRAHLAWHRGQK